MCRHAAAIEQGDDQSAKIELETAHSLFEAIYGYAMTSLPPTHHVADPEMFMLPAVSTDSGDLTDRQTLSDRIFQPNYGEFSNFTGENNSQKVYSFLIRLSASVTSYVIWLIVAAVVGSGLTLIMGQFALVVGTVDFFWAVLWRTGLLAIALYIFTAVYESLK
jgi:hypothetical protein